MQVKSTRLAVFTCTEATVEKLAPLKHLLVFKVAKSGSVLSEVTRVEVNSNKLCNVMFCVIQLSYYTVGKCWIIKG